MVCHTINPKLFPEQVAYIINHAEDKILFADVLVMPLLEALKAHLGKVEAIVVMTDSAHMPESTLPNVLCYEELLAGNQMILTGLNSTRTQPAGCVTPQGQPATRKALSTAIVQHCFMLSPGSLPDVTGASNMETSLPVVPMFHVNAWGAPYAALMVGMKLVLPGPKMADGEALTDLMNSEQVTFSSGVPTIWLALLDYLDSNNLKVPSLTRVSVGGAACPRIIIERFRRKHDCTVVQGWE